MPFDNSQFEVGFAPAITPAHPSRPATDEVLSVLTKARAWLSDPAHWYRQSFAPPHTCLILQSAPSTCAWGACMRAAGQSSAYEDQHPASKSASEFLALVLKGTDNPLDVSDFNDAETTTHADVLSLFDRAIEARHAALVAEGAPIK